jgi:hypothetical protein
MLERHLAGTVDAMVDNVDDRWLSVSEAARQLSVSRQALHHRIKRGTLDSRRGNRGQTLVRIPPTVDRQVPPGTVSSIPSGVDAADPHPQVADAPESMPLAAHREIVATLHASLERQERQHQDEVIRLREDAASRVAQINTAHKVALNERDALYRSMARMERVWFVLYMFLAAGVLALTSPVLRHMPN